MILKFKIILKKKTSLFPITYLLLIAFTINRLVPLAIKISHFQAIRSGAITDDNKSNSFYHRPSLVRPPIITCNNENKGRKKNLRSRTIYFDILTQFQGEFMYSHEITHQFCNSFVLKY